MNTNLPTLGDYLEALNPILGAVTPADCDTRLNTNEPAITVGFTDMVPVTGSPGIDPLVAYVTFDPNDEPMVTFHVYPATRH